MVERRDMKKPRAIPDLPECPCQSGRAYAACCGEFIDHGILPATAELLMRSRYTAFVLAQEDYLLQTWHASTRPVQLGLQNTQAVKWLGLRILHSADMSPDAGTATVEFVARYQVNGRAERLHEISHFVREAGRWFYRDGLVQST